jgi:radical SAM superfamily enzyme YgiQ (UPF0313 family)
MTSVLTHSDILLVAVNARYRHSSFGLRCLQANLGDLEPRSGLVEFTINQRPQDMLEAIVSASPRIVGIGVYIWNVGVVTELVSMLRTVMPEVSVVLGGPEVSHEWAGQPLQDLAHFVVQGEGEQVFRSLCAQLLDGKAPTEQVLAGTTPSMDDLALPYRLYTDEDIQHRVIYVEASRGCPYLCQFCLSALDKQVRDVPLEGFFAALDVLWERGARDFKFIDRTFNLSIAFSMRILRFFLDKDARGLSLHFEMVPERLPEELLATLAEFAPGVVQLEVGVQTFNPEIAKRISRPMKIERVCTHLSALHAKTDVHMHVDLIVGLPGETVASFGAGFDRLQAIGPHEIQVGILKRLKGSPIRQHSQTFSMVYSPIAPFEVMKTSAISFEELNEMKRFARFWDLVVNSGQLPGAAPLIWRDQPSVFAAFREFSVWVYRVAGRSSHISLIRLSTLLCDFLMERRGLEEEVVGPLLVADLGRSQGRRIPKRLQIYESKGRPRGDNSPKKTGLARQRRHRDFGVEKDRGHPAI